MIATWMLYGIIVTVLVAVGGYFLERVANLAHSPRRQAWLLSTATALLLVSAVAWRAAEAPPAPGVALSSELTTPGSVPVNYQPAAETSKPHIPTLLHNLRILPGALALRLDSWNGPLLLGWGVASGTLLLGYLLALVVMMRRRRCWTHHQVHGTTVLLSPHEGPAVIGVLQPQVVIPEWALGLDAEAQSLLLRHEREHIRARDPLLLHVTAVAVLLMPWNAAMWWIHRRLRLSVELDCDDRVLRAQSMERDPAEVARYGDLLLTVAHRRSRHLFQAAPAFLDHASSLSQRISAMCAQPVRHPRLQRLVAVLLTGTLLLAAAFLPAPRLQAQGTGDGSVVRLIGSPSVAPAPPMARNETRELLSRYFPDVLRGEGPASVVFVRDADGRITGTLPTHVAEQMIAMARRESGGTREREMQLREKDVAAMDGAAAYRKFDVEVPSNWSEMTSQQKREFELDNRMQEKAVTREDRTVGVERPVKVVTEQQVQEQRQQLEEQKAKLRSSGTMTGDQKRELDARTKRLTVYEKSVERPTRDVEAQRADDIRQKLVERPTREVDVTRADAIRMKMDVGNDLTVTQRQMAERMAAADVVEHGAGEVGPNGVRIFFITLRGGN